MNYIQRILLPEERCGKKAKEADKQLQVDPVANEIGKESEEASCEAPEVLDHNSSERSVFSRKQLTPHHETG